jgi:hypothetical protein
MPRTYPFPPIIRHRRPDVDLKHIPYSKSEDDIRTLLKQCQDDISSTKCVVFKVYSGFRTVQDQSTFDASYNTLKSTYSANSHVKFINLNYESHFIIIELLNLFEGELPYFKIFHNGTLAKTYLGLENFADIDQDVQTYSI